MKVINIAIIAHVDHGKTTLTDAILKQSGVFRENEVVQELVMDSNPLERERGITIFSKNCSIHYKDVKINIVDTPGHADFSSEVERVLKMVDCVLLLVDAQEGPMPQTKFVLQKSLALGIRPIVLINKIDKSAARPDHVLNMIFDLFVALNATPEQLDFPVLYTNGRKGIAQKSSEEKGKDLTPLFELLLKHVSLYPDKNEEFLQMQIASLAYDDYLGRIAIGRVFRGKLEHGKTIAVCRRNGVVEKYRIAKLFSFEGLKQVETLIVECGDLAAVAGIPEITIGETIADSENPEALPILKIDEPTLKMNFFVNDSPFAGKEGKFVTTRNIKERLERELETNVGLRVDAISNSDGYTVSGRGELHLSILLENMRRESFEIQVSRPEVIFKEVDGKTHEPMELLVVTVPEQYAGVIIEKCGKRKGIMQNMVTEHKRTRLEYSIPTRGLIGLRSEFIIETHGEGILDHSFSHYEEYKGEIERRKNGVLVSQEQGESTAYAIWKIQERGIMFINPGEHLYAGMIVGENAKDGDLIVNVCKGKKLSNMRTTSSDAAIMLTPPTILSLEQALEFIEDDEYVEITPKSIRLRKKILKETDRKRTKTLAVLVFISFFFSACSNASVQPITQPAAETALTVPIAQYSDRLTFKAFGEFIEDRFRGYHVGDDIEYDDKSEVAVRAIADGKIVHNGNTEGYGGLIVVEHKIDSKVITALYGHLDIAASELKKGDDINKGQFLANLGDDKSPETDGERRHLHFGLYEGSELRRSGYESSEQKVGSWINPYEFFLTQGVITVKKSRVFNPAIDLGGDIFKIEFTIPEDWEVEYIPSLKALNLFTLSGVSTARQRSQILIRYFDAAEFLTLPTVKINSITDLTVGKGDYTARRYDIEKKSGVADFADQPEWRNQRHIVTDFRGSDGFTRYYVVAANPLLDKNIYEAVLKSMRVVGYWSG